MVLLLGDTRDELAGSVWADVVHDHLGGRPPQVTRAIENLKLAMRMRLSGEPLTPAQASAFAVVLDHAAQQLEQI